MTITNPRRTAAKSGLTIRPKFERRTSAGTAVFTKEGWLKGPLYCGPTAEELEAAGVDLDKPIEIVVRNV